MESTRTELYRLIREKLRGIEEVRHVGLWNENVAYIEQEPCWERPAVFVEFCPIKWETLVHGVAYRADPLVKLHIVTDWSEGASDGAELGVFDLPESIHKALTCTHGETFLQLDLVESDTNHNHEEIVESVEVYQYVAKKLLE